MKTRLEEKLLEQGFADTRTPSLDDAITRLHSAICRLDYANLRLLQLHYPEAIHLARKYAELNPCDNQLKGEGYE